MKTRTKVVVIGGGIAGCSTLYHLTQEGWSDVVLLERNDLTSGTTWHSAAQVTNFGMNQTMVGLKTHSINLYKELADDPNHQSTTIMVMGESGLQIQKSKYRDTTISLQWLEAWMLILKSLMLRNVKDGIH